MCPRVARSVPTPCANPHPTCTARGAPVAQGGVRSVGEQQLQHLGVPLARGQVRGRARVIVLPVRRVPCGQAAPCQRSRRPRRSGGKMYMAKPEFVRLCCCAQPLCARRADRSQCRRTGAACPLVRGWRTPMQRRRPRACRPGGSRRQRDQRVLARCRNQCRREEGRSSGRRAPQPSSDAAASASPVTAAQTSALRASAPRFCSAACTSCRVLRARAQRQGASSALVDLAPAARHPGAAAPPARRASRRASAAAGTEEAGGSAAVCGPAPRALLGRVGAGVGGLAAAGRAAAAVGVEAQAGQQAGHDGLVLLRERGRQLLVVRLAHRQQRHVLGRARLRPRAQGFLKPRTRSAPWRPGTVPGVKHFSFIRRTSCSQAATAGGGPVLERVGSG